MDYYKLFYPALFAIVYLIKDVQPFVFNVGSNQVMAIYGSNTFTLSCSYTLDSNPAENLYFIELHRKRPEETAAVKIVEFPNNQNVSYQDKTLQSRAVSTWPSSGNQINLVFSSVLCNDKAEYTWKATYYSQTVMTENRTVNVFVKANTIFSSDGGVTYLPSANVQEGDEVVFTCSGDVGNEPVGHLGWFYYLNNNTNSANNASSQATPSTPVYRPSSCSYTRTSTLRLKMTKEFNNIIVRCTVQQDTFDQFGEGYKQTSNINVYYSPRINPITGATEAVEGNSVTYSCTADSNPPSKYYWVLPDGNITVGAVTQLANLTVDDSGVYVCVAYNEYLSANHTVNATKTLIVRERTTPAPTTTTTTTPSTGTTNKEVSTQKSTSEPENNTATIVGAVVGSFAFVVIVAVAIVCYCRIKGKKKEIEEPPEKPRNNQDLSFYGHRPDLVSGDHGMKNNMGQSNLNSSFNNSFDSSSDIKPRNIDDGLNYVDLQFDDKPRSRRPVQLLDNTSTTGTMYSDIVNPRV